MDANVGSQNRVDESVTPTLSVHFDAGLRCIADLNVRDAIEVLFGETLVAKRCDKPGGICYEYAPYPVAEYGLTDLSVRLSVPAGSDSADSSPAGLRWLVSIGWRGDNLLDLGRLHRLLQKRFRAAYQVIGYAVVVSPAATTPILNRIQGIEFDWDRALPKTTPPCLQTTLDFEFGQQHVTVISAELESALKRDPVLLLSSLQLTLGQPRSESMRAERDEHIRLRLAFATPSLLDLGCVAETLESRWAEILTVLSYRVQGCFLQDGPEFCLERRFDSARDLMPAWQTPMRENRK